MARQGYPRLSILPAAQAAAHLAVEQNSWLHMVCQDSGFWFPGWARPVGFTDLAEAADLYKCKSVLFVPIPGLPAQEASKISTSGEVREAPMGVISLGLDEKLPFDDKLLMDALILGCALSDYLPADAVSVLQRIYDIFADLDELAELSARRTISQEDVAGSLQEPFEFDRRECEECPSESELSCRRARPERNSYDSDIVMARHTVAGDVDPAASIAEPAGRAAQHSVWAAYRARKAAAAEKGHRESVDSFDSMASSVSSGSLEVNPTAQSPVWLAFRNPRLEKSFRMWHTAQRMTVDAVLIVLACALYITCGYLVPAVQLGRHAPFSYPLAIVALLAPAALMQAGQYKYQRRREELMTCLCTFLTAHTAFVVVPSLMAMLPDTCAGDALPARMTCSLVRLLVSLSLCATGAGSLIRFRRFLPMQILNSAITALSLPCMCAWATSGQAEGFSKYLNCGIVAQTLLGLVAPSVAVWGLEKLARQAFLRMPMAQFATKQQ
ncbi:hypothetical protein WJX72_004314 [[Myrmecia] bisecta]|uniref:Uncharacterized protein n=1 Tax=[Myrmecia] bisecta TaxID=41462 RepID=A0AAW1QAJ8_9CHLO